jgi:DNA (cytosine-5)-methyltransferase 1
VKRAVILLKIPVSDNQAYQQFGNRVAVNVIEKIAEQILKYLKISNEKSHTYIRRLAH